MNDLQAVRLMRPMCSECGRNGLLYGRVSDLMLQATPQQRKDFHEGMAWFGDGVSANPLAWLCPLCGGLGIFGDLEFG